MILVISECRGAAQKVPASTFADIDVWERRDIQKWIKAHPEMLGQGDQDDELLIVAEEFNQFVYRESGGIKDRLDLLGIDRTGTLVVIELKRDLSAGSADLQAIRYAAMVSAMTLEELTDIFVAYLKGQQGNEEVTREEAGQRLQDFAFAYMDNPELTKRPRIILGSQNFSPQLTTTVPWLQPHIVSNVFDLRPIRWMLEPSWFQM